MNARIMLVDDHEVVRQGLRSLLERQDGFTIVAEARDGHSALRLAAEVAPDIVIMDVRMPDLNGVDATRQMVAARPGLRVIALSAQADAQSTSEMLRAGASGYVLKESAFEELVTAINAVAEGKVYLSPAITGDVVRGFVNGGPDHNRSSVYTALSPREREVLQLTAEGHSTKAVANLLHVSVKTIETHRRNIMEKTGIDSVAGLTRYAIREGITVP
jgi:DNA-binding NarL/FixJ family response regulator